MDADALIAEVAKRHGVLLDRRDPVMIVATIAELTMEEARTEIRALVREAADQIAAASGEHLSGSQTTAERIVTGSGAWVGDQVRAAMTESQAAFLAAVRTEAATVVAASRRAWWAAAAAGGAVLLGAGCLAGYLLASGYLPA